MQFHSHIIKPCSKKYLPTFCPMHDAGRMQIASFCSPLFHSFMGVEGCCRYNLRWNMCKSNTVKTTRVTRRVLHKSVSTSVSHRYQKVWQIHPNLIQVRQEESPIYAATKGQEVWTALARDGEEWSSRIVFLFNTIVFGLKLLTHLDLIIILCHLQ